MWILRRTIGTLLGFSLGAFVGAFVAYFQEMYGWDRKLVAILLFFGFVAPMFFVFAPIENRKLWKKYRIDANNNGDNDNIDIDYEFPPIFFSFCVGLLVLPYVFHDSLVVGLIQNAIFGT